MRDKIISILSQATKTNAEEIGAKINETGLWDSFARVELVLLLEEAFGIIFYQDEIGEMNTPAKVIELVQAKVNK